MPAPPPPTGQGFAPGLNPLGLFSLKTQGNSTISSGNQSYNPGDVPAPPQYGTGQGAPTNYTQTNFGGQVAPDMQAQLDNVHSFVLAPATPAPPQPPPSTPGGPAPTNPYRPIHPGIGPDSSYTRSPSYSPELTDAQLFANIKNPRLRSLLLGDSSGADNVAKEQTLPNTALSQAAMKVPGTSLAFGDGGSGRRGGARLLGAA